MVKEHSRAELEFSALAVLEIRPISSSYATAHCEVFLDHFPRVGYWTLHGAHTLSHKNPSSFGSHVFQDVNIYCERRILVTEESRLFTVLYTCKKWKAWLARACSVVEIKR